MASDDNLRYLFKIIYTILRSKINLEVTVKTDYFLSPVSIDH
jgi:hypothetical protein